MKTFETTAEKDRHYICEIGRLLWGDDKQCYAADAVYRQIKIRFQIDPTPSKMRIQAYDLKGNSFTKEVSIKNGLQQNPKSDESGYYGEPVEFGYYGDIIDFGWPCEYYINSLKRNLPFEKDLCIDMGGLNHKGSPVYVSKNDLNYIFNNLESIPRK